MYNDKKNKCFPLPGVLIQGYAIEECVCKVQCLYIWFHCWNPSQRACNWSTMLNVNVIFQMSIFSISILKVLLSNVYCCSSYMSVYMLSHVCNVNLKNEMST